MKLKSIFCGLLAIAAAVGCKEEIPLEASLTVSRPAAEIEAEGGDIIVEVTSNTAWQAEADADWVSAVYPSQGTASEKPVTVTIVVDANEGAEERTATVTFTAGTLSKTTVITQAGKQEENGGDDVTGSDSDLFVAWVFSSDMKAVNKPMWHQSDNDPAAGLSDSHLSATIGTGDIKYYQVDKSGFSTDKIRRHTGGSGEPMAYGCWEGDYFLFEASHNLSENSNASISFSIEGKTGTPKYWLLEYKDGNEWKPALSTETLGTIEYNVVCQKSDPAMVEADVVLRNATDKVQFRMTCVTTVGVDDAPNTKPADDTYLRIDPSSVIIKGGQITDADKDALVAPSMTLDKEELSAEAAGVSEKIALTSNIEWTATSDASWASVLPPSGSASPSVAEITVSIAENVSAETRTATLTFTGTYHNATIVKTVEVTQEGKPAVGTDCDLFVAWALAASMKDVNEKTWKQSGNDLTPGDGGRYMSATTGSGKITYSQVDKNKFETDNIRIYRHTGKAGEPMVYGAWVDDHFLFEADYSLPANSNVSIAFALLGGSDKVLKYWLLEYKDGDQWKKAGVEGSTERKDGSKVEYNVVCGTKEQHTLVNKSVVITNAADKVQFRLTCVSEGRLDGKSMNSPADGAYIRMNRDYSDAAATEHIPIIIKGGTITDADFSAVVAPTPEPDPEPEPTDLLNVKWEWNANQGDSRTEAEVALYDARTVTWHQEDTDTAAGDGGKYIDANVGTGKLTFVQFDKSAYASSEIEMRRHLGKNAEPVVYGAWENDYFLFEASDGQTYPAGTKVSISFGIKAKKNAVKTWRLEYLDGTEWKTALAEVSFTTKTQTINTTVTAAASNSAFKFRLLCISKVNVDTGAAMDAPAGNQRLDPTIPLEIKVVE